MTKTKDDAGVPLVANVRQCYDGVWYKSGDKFRVKDEKDAADLVAMKFASRPPRRSVVRRALDALGPELDSLPVEKRNSYRRRDMQAEAS